MFASQCSVNETTQAFPLDRQEWIQINSSGYSFSSCGREAPFQDCRYILTWPLRGLAHSAMEHQGTFHKHTEARPSKLWQFAGHSQARATCTFSQKLQASALWKTTATFAKVEKPQGRAPTYLSFQDTELFNYSIQEANNWIHSRTAAQRLLQLCHHHGDVACLSVNVLLCSSKPFVQCFIWHLHGKWQAIRICLLQSLLF